MTDWTTPTIWNNENPISQGNLNKLSQGLNYLKEVVDGDHTTKIPSEAIDASVVIMMEVFS
jgi:hypothetical protein